MTMSAVLFFFGFFATTSPLVRVFARNKSSNLTWQISVNPTPRPMKKQTNRRLLFLLLELRAKHEAHVKAARMNLLPQNGRHQVASPWGFRDEAFSGATGERAPSIRDLSLGETAAIP
jgi:hypothetical protein